MPRKHYGPVALAVALLSAPWSKAAETFEIDAVHSNAAFTIRHLVSRVSGQFNEFSGTLRIDREDLTRSSVQLDIRAASIDSKNERRDAHLRSADFFDVEKHPDITFRSKKIEKAGESSYRVTGTFTMHGVTREITVPVEVLGFVSHPRMGERAGFSSSFSLKRTDYGVNWNSPMDAGQLVLGDEVRIQIDIEAVRREEPDAGEEGPTGKK